MLSYRASKLTTKPRRFHISASGLIGKKCEEGKQATNYNVVGRSQSPSLGPSERRLLGTAYRFRSLISMNRERNRAALYFVASPIIAPVQCGESGERSAGGGVQRAGDYFVNITM